jgi:hypothetical protein
MSGITTATALLISAGVGLAATGITTGLELSNQPSGPTPPSASTTAQQQAEASNAAAQAQAEALQKRRGLASTILTSPLGAQGSASIQKATLG